ncbi:MAG: TonB-dependent receptor [Porphyromonadaceae bacterium]|nr:TonB-dependent receptor [Porphyromonadaceae bacterium]
MNKLKTVLPIIGFFFTIHAIPQETSMTQPDSIISLREVVVNAYQINTRQRQVPGSISVLSAEEIVTADGNNFAGTLHTLPGIYMHSGNYSTSRIVIRGVGSRTPYNTNRIKAYLNDIPITSSDGISTPEDIELTGIGRMEVIKGPASALYGSGLGGNINIYTPEAESNKVETLLQYGSFQTMKTAAAGSYHRENLHIGGNLSHLQSDGFRENNRYRRTVLLSSGKWQHQAYSLEYTLMWIDLFAQLPSSVGKTLYESDPHAAAVNWKAVEGYKKYQRAIAGVTLTNRISEKWNNRLTLFGRWADSYERRPFNNLDDGTSGGGIRNRLTYHASNWDALIGFEWVNDTYRWQMDLKDELINRNKETRNHSNLFGMVYWQPAPTWNISLGGALNKVYYRLIDQFSEDGDQSGKRDFPAIFSPRFGVNYAPSRSLAFYASVGHGFSLPSPEETLLPEGDINRELRPEQGVQYEAGVRLNLFDDATQLEATVYRINLTDLLVTKRLAEDIFTGINAGRTRHTGIELMLKQGIFRFRDFPGRLYINVNYTWSRNRFIDFNDNGEIYNKNELPGIPSHIAQAAIQWQPSPQFRLDVQCQYVGEQYMNDANSLKNDDYLLVGLRTSYHFPVPKAGTFELFAGTNNITNTRYSPMITVNAVAFGNAEPRYYYPGMPRHYYAGIKWAF